MDEIDPSTNIYLAYGVATTGLELGPAPGVLNPVALGSGAAAAPALGTKVPQLPELQEPAPDQESVFAFAADLQQREPATIPGISATSTPPIAFGALDVRQGFLENCPLAAILVAMAHVDEGRPASAQRLPAMVTLEDMGGNVQPSRRAIPLLEAEKSLKLTPTSTFLTRWVAKVRFSGRSRPETETLVLHWNAGLRRLHFAWAKTTSLGPSLIEKAYLFEVMKPRDYSTLATQGRLPDDLAQGLLDARQSVAGTGLSYDRIKNLPGLLVLIDLAGSGTEIPLAGLSNAGLRQALARHGDRATIVGTLTDDQLPEALPPDQRKLVGNHYLAVVGLRQQDPKDKGSPILVELVDAQGRGADLRTDDRYALTLEELRREVGEIVQEVPPPPAS